MWKPPIADSREIRNCKEEGGGKDYQASPLRNYKGGTPINKGNGSHGYTERMSETS